MFDIPRALGFDKTDSDDFEFESFGQALATTLKELQSCHEVMRKKFIEVIGKEGLGRSGALSLVELRKACGNLYGLEAFAPSGQGLSGLITRLTKVQAEDEEWFENVLMYLGRKPSSKWGDADFGEAMYRLKDSLREIRDLEKIRIQTKSENIESDDIDFYLLKMVKKGHEPKDKVVVVDAGTRDRVEEVMKTLNASLGELDDDLRGACIALLMESIAAEDSSATKGNRTRLQLVQDETK